MITKMPTTSVSRNELIFLPSSEKSNTQRSLEAGIKHLNKEEKGDFRGRVAKKNTINLNVIAYSPSASFRSSIGDIAMGFPCCRTARPPPSERRDILMFAPDRGESIKSRAFRGVPMCSPAKGPSGLALSLSFSFSCTALDGRWIIDRLPSAPRGPNGGGGSMNG